MSQIQPLDPIAEPAFTVESLNPDNLQHKYKVWKAVGKAKRKQIEWGLSLIAQKELAKIGMPTGSFDVERWLIEHSQQCPEANLVVLSYLVEPMPNATPVSDLFWNDKLEDAFMEDLTSGFTTSSSMMFLVLLQKENAQLKKQIANSETGSSKPSPGTVKRTGRIKTSTEQKEKALA